jgi:AAHS family 4-hydroxybenzoate transporter-like MFS transporter
MKTIDVGRLIDESRWTGYQKLLIFGTALTIILDGVDNQLIGPTIPALMAAWNLKSDAFSLVAFAGPIGMMFGGLFGGLFGDRVGRRTALLTSVISFAVVTLAVSFATGPGMLAVLRFLAGLGLGGAMPNAAVLASEYVPRARRTIAVTMTIVCVPLGGTLASFVSGLVIERYGWQMPWRIGGILPIVLALVLFKVLPESPKFLARHRERWPELRKVLSRMGHSIPADAEFVAEAAPSAGVVKTKATYGELFAGHRLRDTIGLWFGFFFCLMGNYIAIQWLPTMLTAPEIGFARPVAIQILTVFNLGGVGGALLAAVIIQKLGSRISMLVMSALSIVGAIVLAMMKIEPGAALGIFILVGYTGTLMNAVQTTMYALAAQVYPLEIRGSGVGTAVAIGRIGHALTGPLGPPIMRGGTGLYFGSMGVCMGVVFLAMALVERHIEKNKPISGAH